jgi:t-SNARE complex subunit (syntaxin)
MVIGDEWICSLRRYRAAMDVLNSPSQHGEDAMGDMRRALATAQEESRLAAELGQALMNQKREVLERAEKEVSEVREELERTVREKAELAANLKVAREQREIAVERIQVRGREFAEEARQEQTDEKMTWKGCIVTR